MAEIKVTLYERLKIQGRWRELPVKSRVTKRTGSLFSGDERTGLFLISWYEKRKKQRMRVKGLMHPSLSFLSEAMAFAQSKAWYLNSRRFQTVTDPTQAPSRLTINEQIPLYLAAKSGCKKTLSAHKLALREFEEFTQEQHLNYMDEISKPLLKGWYEELLDGGNVPFTAANKLLKVNSFYRAVLKLDAGKGIITKKDYKRELTNRKVPEVYTKQELTALFQVMDPDEHLLFSVFNEAGLRKKELMHLEDTDLIMDELAPEKFKCELRIESNPQYGYQTKTGAERNVLIPKELMDRLQERKATPRPSKLLFGTTWGKPDYHLWDRLKAIARRAGLDPTTCWVHKFRGTCATRWLRSKELGGKGWDIGFVRQQLGHDDYKSIEAYIAIVKTEEQALKEQKEQGLPQGLEQAPKEQKEGRDIDAASLLEKRRAQFLADSGQEG